MSGLLLTAEASSVSASARNNAVRRSNSSTRQQGPLKKSGSNERLADLAHAGDHFATLEPPAPAGVPAPAAPARSSAPLSVSQEKTRVAPSPLRTDVDTEDELLNCRFTDSELPRSPAVATAESPKGPRVSLSDLFAATLESPRKLCRAGYGVLLRTASGKAEFREGLNGMKTKVASHTLKRVDSSESIAEKESQNEPTISVHESVTEDSTFEAPAAEQSPAPHSTTNATPRLKKFRDIIPSTFRLQRTLLLDAAIAYFLGSLFVVVESSIPPGSGPWGLTEHDGAELLSCGAYTLGSALWLLFVLLEEFEDRRDAWRKREAGYEEKSEPPEKDLMQSALQLLMSGDAVFLTVWMYLLGTTAFDVLAMGHVLDDISNMSPEWLMHYHLHPAGATHHSNFVHRYLVLVPGLIGSVCFTLGSFLQVADEISNGQDGADLPAAAVSSSAPVSSRYTRDSFDGVYPEWAGAGFSIDQSVDPDNIICEREVCNSEHSRHPIKMEMVLARAARLVQGPLNFAGSIAILTSAMEDATSAWKVVSQQSMLVTGICFTLSSAAWVVELVLQQRMKCMLYKHISHRDAADRLMRLGRVLMNTQLQRMRGS